MSKRFNSNGITFFILAISWISFVHIAGCLFFVVAAYENRINPSAPNWANSNAVGVPPGTNLFNTTLAHQYLISFYVTALTLVGQPPALFTAAETIFNLGVVVIGLIVFM